MLSRLGNGLSNPSDVAARSAFPEAHMGTPRRHGTPALEGMGKEMHPTSLLFNDKRLISPGSVSGRGLFIDRARSPRL